MARMLAGLVSVAVLSYVGICIGLYVLQRSLMYYPQYTQVDVAATDFSLVRGIARLWGAWRARAARHA